jgi:uncharacterized protein
MSSPLTIEALPMPLHWRLGPPERWAITGADALTIDAGARTDLFADPGEPGSLVENAPAVLGIPPGPPTAYQLSARVTPRFTSTFDAGVLLVHQAERAWAKLCFEYSPQRRPTVVSVVTRGASDDCNSFTVDAPHVWLRLARRGPAYAFHASADGGVWHLVRYFSLDGASSASSAGGASDGRSHAVVGFLAQSPTGQGCSVTFDGIRFTTEPLVELRDGS